MYHFLYELCHAKREFNVCLNFKHANRHAWLLNGPRVLSEVSFWPSYCVQRAKVLVSLAWNFAYRLSTLFSIHDSIIIAYCFPYCFFLHFMYYCSFLCQTMITSKSGQKIKWEEFQMCVTEALTSVSFLIIVNSLFSRITMSFFTDDIWDINCCTVISCK